jgi:hypothetical protein
MIKIEGSPFVFAAWPAVKLKRQQGRAQKS